MITPDLDEPAGFEIGCLGARHRIGWCGGHLVLLDHPDPDADAVLAALGAELPDCLAVAALWADTLADGGFLAEWSGRERPEPDRPGRIVVALNRLRLEGVQDLLVELPARRAARMGLALATFPPTWQDRAALAVADRILDQTEPARHELAPHLARAVRVRARSAFVTSLSGWRDVARPAALVRFQCRVLTDPTAPPAVDGRLDGSASWCELSLGPRWLIDVWGRGLAVVDGHLVATVSVDGSAWALDWLDDGSPPRRAALRPVRLDRDGGPAQPLRWLS